MELYGSSSRKLLSDGPSSIGSSGLLSAESDNGSGKVDDALGRCSAEARARNENNKARQQSSIAMRTSTLDNAPHAGRLHAFFLITVAHIAATIIDTS